MYLVALIAAVTVLVVTDHVTAAVVVGALGIAFQLLLIVGVAASNSRATVRRRR